MTLLNFRGRAKKKGMYQDDDDILYANFKTFSMFWAKIIFCFLKSLVKSFLGQITTFYLVISQLQPVLDHNVLRDLVRRLQIQLGPAGGDEFCHHRRTKILKTKSENSKNISRKNSKLFSEILFFIIFRNPRILGVMPCPLSDFTYMWCGFDFFSWNY